MTRDRLRAAGESEEHAGGEGALDSPMHHSICFSGTLSLACANTRLDSCLPRWTPDEESEPLHSRKKARPYAADKMPLDSDTRLLPDDAELPKVPLLDASEDDVTPKSSVWRMHGRTFSSKSLPSQHNSLHTIELSLVPQDSEDLCSPRIYPRSATSSSFGGTPRRIATSVNPSVFRLASIKSQLTTDHVSVVAQHGDDAPDLLRASLQRARFSIMDYSSNGSDLKPCDLARAWAEAAQAAMGSALDTKDAYLLGAAVQQAFEQVDVDRSGSISTHEWMHLSLLESFSPGPAAIEVIDSRIRELDNHDLVPWLVRTWAKVDQQGLGVALQSDLDLDTCQEVSEVLSLNGTDDASYAEFCAHHLGLRQSRVALYLYDLSKNLSHVLSPLLLGTYEEGLWHSSVVVFDKEYFYYGTIQVAEPGETSFKTPTKIIQLGFTLHEEDEFRQHIETLDHLYQPNVYDIFTHNCNDLSDELIQYLLGRHIPNSVRLMSERIANSHLVRAVRPMLNVLLGRRESNGEDEDELKSRFQQDRSYSDLGHAGAHRSNYFGSAYKDMALRVSSRASSDAMGGTASMNLNGSDGGHPPLRRSRSCLLEESKQPRKSKRVALPPVHDSLVLATIPECMAQVVGRVVEVHPDSTSVIRWFDATGCPRVTSSVRSTDLRPYEPPTESSSGFSRAVYREAVETILMSRDDSPRDGDAIGIERQLSKLSVQPVLEGHVIRDGSRSWAECPRGHFLEPVTTSCCATVSDPGHCMLCGLRIHKGEARMACSCPYYLCEDCYQRKYVVARQTTSTVGKAVSMDSMAARCPKKHPMERIVGQPWGHSDTCRSCGLGELGASTPYYMTCRLCAYSICPSCARAQAVLSTRRMPSMLFLKQHSKRITAALRNRGARLSRLLKNSQPPQQQQ